jgi:hypothetical protein
MATMDASEKKDQGNDMIFCCDWDASRHNGECKRKTKIQDKGPCQDTVQTQQQFDIDSIMVNASNGQLSKEADDEKYGTPVKKLRLTEVAAASFEPACLSPLGAHN